MEQKSSIEFMRGLGALPGQKISKIPEAMSTLSDSSRQMLARHAELWDKQGENISGSVKSLRENKNLLDTNSPDYLLMMERLGMGDAERRRFQRDKLGLYSAPVNLAENMIELAEVPEPIFIATEKKLNEMLDEARDAKEASGQQWDFENDHKVVEEMWKKELAKEKRLADERKEVETSFKMTVAAGNRSLMETLVMLESFVPPKPFEANMQERHFSGAESSLRAIATYFDGQPPERIVGWYRMYDQINEQQSALFRILCAAGGGMEGYYDALKQAGETLISRARFHANGHDMRAAYTNDDPGVSTFKLTAEEQVHIKDTLASKELREMQIEMLSHARRLIMLNVSVAQTDVDKPEGKDGLMNKNDAVIDREIDRLTKNAQKFRDEGNAEKADRIQKHIESLEQTKNLNFENHNELMRLVFGSINKYGKSEEGGWIRWKSPDTNREIFTPREILTWYCGSDKLDAREEWLAKMLTLLTWKTADGKRLSDALQNASEAEVLAIAKDILEKSHKFRNKLGDKLMNADPEIAAAKIALISWIEKDKGFQTSGPLAWGFVYKDFGGTVGIQRTVDSGGLYKAYDSVNLWAYWWRWALYKAGWKSATTFFGPASDDWRREKAKHAPDWLPPLERIHENKKISRIHKRFFTDGDTSATDNSNFVLWRARRLTGNDKLTVNEMNSLVNEGKLKPAKIDNIFIRGLEETGWTFGSAYKVPVPMYLPKTFKINVDETMYDKSTGDTIWDLYRAGVMPMDIDWENYNYEALDRMWVSMSMLTRFAKFFVDPYQAERDPQYMDFFKEPGLQSITEMAKRVYLAFRDRPEGYQQYIVAIVPFMIAQNTAKVTGLLSTDLGDAGSKEIVVKRFNFMMAQWIQGAMFAPQVVLDEKQLWNGAKQEIQSMRNDIALMIMYYKHIFEKVGQAAFKFDASTLSKVFRDQIALYKDADMQNILGADKGESNWDLPMTESYKTKWEDGEKAVAATLFGDRR